jgi:hypothetical protein
VVGLIQTAAVHGNLKKVSFFRNRYFTYIFSALTVGGSLIAFFNWNSWCNTGIIEGCQQFILFLVSGFLALIFSFAVSFVVRVLRMGKL